MGYYLIEGFGSHKTCGVNPEIDKYKIIFNYIKQDTLKFLQNGTLTLCICYIQESFVTDDIIHLIHFNTKKLNIQNPIVIVNDYLIEKDKEWCEVKLMKNQDLKLLHFVIHYTKSQMKYMNYK